MVPDLMSGAVRNLSRERRVRRRYAGRKECVRREPQDAAMLYARSSAHATAVPDPRCRRRGGVGAVQKRHVHGALPAAGEGEGQRFFMRGVGAEEKRVRGAALRNAPPGVIYCTRWQNRRIFCRYVVCRAASPCAQKRRFRRQR